MLILWHAFFLRPFSNAPRNKKKNEALSKNGNCPIGRKKQNQFFRGHLGSRSSIRSIHGLHSIPLHCIAFHRSIPLHSTAFHHRIICLIFRQFLFFKVSSFFFFLRGAFENGLKKKACKQISIFEKCVLTVFFKCFVVSFYCGFQLFCAYLDCLTSFCFPFHSFCFCLFR